MDYVINFKVTGTVSVVCKARGASKAFEKAMEILEDAQCSLEDVESLEDVTYELADFYNLPNLEDVRDKVSEELMEEFDLTFS